MANWGEPGIRVAALALLVAIAPPAVHAIEMWLGYAIPPVGATLDGGAVTLEAFSDASTPDSLRPTHCALVRRADAADGAGPVRLCTGPGAMHDHDTMGLERARTVLLVEAAGQAHRIPVYAPRGETVEVTFAFAHDGSVLVLHRGLLTPWDAWHTQGSWGNVARTAAFESAAALLAVGLVAAGARPLYAGLLLVPATLLWFPASESPATHVRGAWLLLALALAAGAAAARRAARLRQERRAQVILASPDARPPEENVQAKGSSPP